MIKIEQKLKCNGEIDPRRELIGMELKYEKIAQCIIMILTIMRDGAKNTSRWAFFLYARQKLRGEHERARKLAHRAQKPL